MPMPAKQRKSADTLGVPGLKVHELKPGEKMARIEITLDGADVSCLVPGCPFWLHVPIASRTVMEHELKDYYRDHRKHRHVEYQGRTLFEYVLSPDWPKNGSGV
jgi:hypothetical protein